MGSGLILEEKQPGLIKSWRVDNEWLRLNVRHHTGISNLCIVTGFGPSMKPKYNPGDPLLLDRGVTTVETEGIYFFRVAQHGFIKQLQRIPTETGLVIRAKSLNPSYDPFDITAKMEQLKHEAKRNAAGQAIKEAVEGGNKANPGIPTLGFGSRDDGSSGV